MTADEASGNSGAAGFIGPISQRVDSTMARAGRPVKTFVTPCAGRFALQRRAIGGARHRFGAKEVCRAILHTGCAELECEPTRRRASAMPPAATTGTRTARTICGTRLQASRLCGLTSSRQEHTAVAAGLNAPARQSHPLHALRATEPHPRLSPKTEPSRPSL